MTNNVIDLESYKKIGRNQTCLCGSGKKYKHCCYNKEIQFTLDDDVKVVLEIDDTSLDGAKRYLRQTPSSAYTCKDFDVLGVQLHELGYKELAIKFLNTNYKRIVHSTGNSKTGIKFSKGVV